MEMQEKTRLNFKYELNDRDKSFFNSPQAGVDAI
jgi:hypothetical protein